MHAGGLMVGWGEEDRGVHQLLELNQPHPDSDSHSEAPHSQGPCSSSLQMPENTLGTRREGQAPCAASSFCSESLPVASPAPHPQLHSSALSLPWASQGPLVTLGAPGWPAEGTGRPRPKAASHRRGIGGSLGLVEQL